MFSLSASKMFTREKRILQNIKVVHLICLFSLVTHTCHSSAASSSSLYGYGNYTQARAGGNCLACATCAPPCAAATPAAATPTCSNNPCYFRSLPFACSAEQCADYVSQSGENGKALIVNLPAELCVTTCQLEAWSSEGTPLYRFGACSRYDDLAVQIRDSISAGVEDAVYPTLTCANDPCFVAYVDTILYTAAAMVPPIEYNQDTVLQCTLTLKDKQRNDVLLATTQFRMNIQYVDPADCGYYEEEGTWK
ncbi:uncharacterized protein LOC129582376 [Paramacrobiotus metropolitanus]|uniref:uncharacterized protein LOC129582376 n=1 Tax=Paramacrobiotus metropolitanus TaxID=2943436 RepID=UPI0024458396|nr:uncharacterized protein LOC129582376 [Paramacrobiotus metropolitanus]